MRRSLALCLLTALLVTGCTVTPKAKPAASTATGSGTVRVLVIGGSGLDQALFQAFNNANPGVKTESVPLPDGDDFNAIVAKIKSGDPKIDAIVAPANTFLFTQGVVAPLDDMVKAQNISLKEYGDTIEMGKYQGKLMGLPVTVSPIIVMYNKDMFDKAGLKAPAAGWTWDEFVNDAEALAKIQLQQGEAAKAWGAGISPWTMADLLLTAGQGPTDPDLGPLQATMERLHRLQSGDKVLAPADLGEAESDYHLAFAQGEIGMLLTYWDYSFAHTRPSFAWNVVPMPGSDKTPGTATLAMVTANAENKANAEAFVRFVSSADGASAMVHVPGAPVPAFVNDAVTKDWLAHSTLKDDAAFMLHLKYLPTTEYPEQLAALVLQEADAAVNGKKTVAEAIKAYEQARAPIVSKK